MTLLWVVVAVIAVLLLAGLMRRSAGPRAPRPGEELPQRPNTPVTDDMVRLRTLDTEEAQVVRGLLETSGIPVALRGADPLDVMVTYGRRPPMRFDLYVSADRVEEAEALLAAPG
jgi:hypothetical protein